MKIIDKIRAFLKPNKSLGPIGWDWTELDKLVDERMKEATKISEKDNPKDFEKMAFITTDEGIEAAKKVKSV